MERVRVRGITRAFALHYPTCLNPRASIHGWSCAGYALSVHRPKSILLSILLLTGFLAYHAQHIRLDSSVESLLPKGDPEKAYYDEIRGLFGSDEVGVIGIITDKPKSPHCSCRTLISHMLP